MGGTFSSTSQPLPVYKDRLSALAKACGGPNVLQMRVHGHTHKRTRGVKGVWLQ